MKNKKFKAKVLSLALTSVMFGGVLAPMSAHAAVENGWEDVNGNRYWYENGVKQGTEGRGKEIYDPGSNAWYWLDQVDDGKMAVSKDVYQESKADDAGNIGKWVRYDENGHMVKGWDVTENGTYYFDLVYGTMFKGEKEIDGVTYWFNSDNGVMESCSVGMDNHWVNIGGSDFWYEGGVRQGYDANDPAYRGKEIYDPGSDAWYWLDNVQQGAKAVSKDVYQESKADDAGNIGKWVRYDAEGHMIKGWNTNENGKYYFDPVYGTMAKGVATISGIDYRFNESSGICEGEAKEPEKPDYAAPTTVPAAKPTDVPTTAPTAKPTDVPTTAPMCSHCNGSGFCKKCVGGECYNCFGSGTINCTSCSGSGNCRSCYGTRGEYKRVGGKVKWVNCTTCRGSGTCKSCSGSGKKTCNSCNGRGTCNYCHGTGYCPYCGGSGK